MNETAITIDHDNGRVRVSTTSSRYATQLKRAGIKQLQDLGPYTDWEGTADQLRPTLFRKGKGSHKGNAKALADHRNLRRRRP